MPPLIRAANNFRYGFASRGDRALYCGDENYPLLWDSNLLYALAAEPRTAWSAPSTWPDINEAIANCLCPPNFEVTVCFARNPQFLPLHRNSSCCCFPIYSW